MSNYFVDLYKRIFSKPILKGWQIPREEDGIEYTVWDLPRDRHYNPFPNFNPSGRVDASKLDAIFNPSEEFLEMIKPFRTKRASWQRVRNIRYDQQRNI